MELDILGMIVRWMHILPAAAAVGGTLFMRFALSPAAATLTDDQHRALREGVRSRWAPIVMASITFLLISGLYNFVVYSLRLPLGPYRGLYHALFGIKFILAFIVFFIASALVGRSPAMERFRQQAKRWQSVNLTLLVLIVLLSGGLRAITNEVRNKSPNPPTAKAEEISFAGRMP